MKTVLQRVAQASVTVNDKTVGAIQKGLCVLVGLDVDDKEDDLDYMIKKILNVQVFDDPETGKMWKKGAKELNLEILCISQFTLHGNVSKGKKPDFHRAMKTDQAKDMYAKFLDKLRKEYSKDSEEWRKIQDGEFGAMMSVHIVNDGPVTLVLDSRKPVMSPDSKTDSPVAQ